MDLLHGEEEASSAAREASGLYPHLQPLSRDDVAAVIAVDCAEEGRDLGCNGDHRLELLQPARIMLLMTMDDERDSLP
jgi:hypothetical protein